MAGDPINETSKTVSTNNADSGNGPTTTKSVVTSNNRSLFGTILRGLSYGAGIAGAFAIALNAQFGDQIKAYFENTKKEEYYVATIEQQSNEQKRSNQLIEQLQRYLSEIQQNQGFAIKIANEQRDDFAKKLDLVLADNKTEKAERARIKKELESTSSNTNQLTIQLKKCQDIILKCKK